MRLGLQVLFCVVKPRMTYLIGPSGKYTENRTEAKWGRWRDAVLDFDASRVATTGGNVQYACNDYIPLGWWHSSNHIKSHRWLVCAHVYASTIYVGHECANAHRWIHIDAHTPRCNYSSGEPLKTASLIQTLSILQQSPVLNIPHQLEIKVNTLCEHMVLQGSTYVNVVDVPQLALSFVYVVSWQTVLAIFQMLRWFWSFTHSEGFFFELFYL